MSFILEYFILFWNILFWIFYFILEKFIFILENVIFILKMLFYFGKCILFWKMYFILEMLFHFGKCILFQKNCISFKCFCLDALYLEIHSFECILFLKTLTFDVFGDLLVDNDSIGYVFVHFSTT